MYFGNYSVMIAVICAQHRNLLQQYVVTLFVKKKKEKKCLQLHVL